MVACQVMPATDSEPSIESPKARVTAAKLTSAKTTSTTEIYRRLRSDSARDRIAALQRLSRQPQLAQSAISLVLALLADNRQVDLARYIGSGGFSTTTTSPAAMAASLLAKLERWSAIPLSLRLDDANPVVRQYTIRALGIMANPEQATWLLSALADRNTAVNKEAYLALRKQEAQVYIGLINKLDMQKFSLQQQCLLIQLLGNSRDAAALPVLRRFSNAHNPVLRRASFAALENFPHANLQELILRGINDSDSQVKSNALMLTPQHNSREVMAATFSQLTTENDNVRRTLLKVLPRLTNDKQASIKDWQLWWQAYRSTQ